MLTQRIGKESNRFTLPRAAEPLVRDFSVTFTRPTFHRVTNLILGTILSLRHRTITGILRALGPLAKGQWSDFHRVLCCRVWSTCSLGRILSAMILQRIPESRLIVYLSRRRNEADRAEPQKFPVRRQRAWRCNRRDPDQPA